jgi:DNA-binding transcriptional MerR regulator
VLCGESRRKSTAFPILRRVPQTIRPIYSIGAVARMLELPAPTIRTWETRYGVVVPERTPGGQRLYTREQVEHLRFLKDAVTAGSRPGEAHRLLAERLGDGPAPRVSIATTQPGALGPVLLRQLLERHGFVVVDDAPVVVISVEGDTGTLLSRDLKQDGRRVLALVEAGADDPSADVVLRLPVASDELVDAVRRLGVE